nr:Arm DNA-binding domain-containing protein [Cedecea colo]
MSFIPFLFFSILVMKQVIKKIFSFVLKMLIVFMLFITYFLFFSFRCSRPVSAGQAGRLPSLVSQASRIALGAYPAISLSDARQQREGIRKMLALNINPVQQRAAERSSCTPEKVYKTVALVWHRSNKK